MRQCHQSRLLSTLRLFVADAESTLAMSRRATRGAIEAARTAVEFVAAGIGAVIAGLVWARALGETILTNAGVRALLAIEPIARITSDGGAVPIRATGPADPLTAVVVVLPANANAAQIVPAGTRCELTAIVVRAAGAALAVAEPWGVPRTFTLPRCAVADPTTAARRAARPGVRFARSGDANLTRGARPARSLAAVIAAGLAAAIPDAPLDLLLFLLGALPGLARLWSAKRRGQGAESEREEQPGDGPPRWSRRDSPGERVEMRLVHGRLRI